MVSRQLNSLFTNFVGLYADCGVVRRHGKGRVRARTTRHSCNFDVISLNCHQKLVLPNTLNVAQS